MPTYHQAVLDLLGIVPEFDPERLDTLKERERACGRSFPASVKEWFALRGADEIFHEHAGEDWLKPLDTLGDTEEVRQGYLMVADENQGVVGWYVPLGDGDDPRVLGNEGARGDLSGVRWVPADTTFTNFVFDHVAEFYFGGWYMGNFLTAHDRLPDAEALTYLASRFRRGPTTDRSDVLVYRFFTRRGVLFIKCGNQWERDNGVALWTFDAGSEDALFEFVQAAWLMGTLRETLRAESCTRKTRSRGEDVLRRLREAGPTELL